MPKIKMCETPCSQCPFRRKAPAGWLGSNNPESFVQSALSDISIGCHKAVPDKHQNSKDYANADARAPRCAGALQLMVNYMKRPRDPEMATLIDKLKPNHVDVFSTPDEFCNHHNAARVKSWLL